MMTVTLSWLTAFGVLLFLPREVMFSLFICHVAGFCKKTLTWHYGILVKGWDMGHEIQAGNTNWFYHIIKTTSSPILCNDWWETILKIHSSKGFPFSSLNEEMKQAVRWVLTVWQERTMFQNLRVGSQISGRLTVSALHGRRSEVRRLYNGLVLSETMLLHICLTSIHPLSIQLIVWGLWGRGEAVANHSWHLARSGVHPGEVANISPGNHSHLQSI